MKALKITALFVACRLCWIWLDQCGADLGLGEALPFCLDCSGGVTLIRLLILGAGAYHVYLTLRDQPEETGIHDNDLPLGHTYLIHWHRIALLAVIVTYPLWVWWVDSNTTIPGPDALFITRAICRNAESKGTATWVIAVGFVSLGFRIMHRK